MGARREHEIDGMKRKALSAGFIVVSRCWKHRPRGFVGDETGFISLLLNFGLIGIVLASFKMTSEAVFLVKLLLQ